MSTAKNTANVNATNIDIKSPDVNNHRSDLLADALFRSDPQQEIRILCSTLVSFRRLALDECHRLVAFGLTVHHPLLSPQLLHHYMLLTLHTDVLRFGLHRLPFVTLDPSLASWRR